MYFNNRDYYTINVVIKKILITLYDYYDMFIDTYVTFTFIGQDNFTDKLYQ